MSVIDNLTKFEEQPVSHVIYNMIKWFNFDQVEMNTCVRDEVESRVWMTLKIQKADKTWYVDGQRLDIVKRRLIEFLDNQKVRDFAQDKGGNED